MKTITFIPWLKPGAINGIAFLCSILLITACTAAGESPEPGFPADGTPIEIGNLSIAPGFSQGTPETRVNIIDEPTSWQAGNVLNVATTQYTYSDTDGWQFSSGDKLYMEDYTQGHAFSATYGPATVQADQGTRDLYLAQTRLAGDLTLNGKALSGAMSHQNIDLVVTLTQGNGWASADAFATAIDDFTYKTATDGDITPYRPTGTNTFRAQTTKDDIPAADGTATLFILPLQGGSTGEAGEGGFLKGTYTLPAGTDPLENGQRLTLTITYHATGELTLGNATVSDFTDTDDIDIPGEIKPAGYHYAVYNWETLVEALEEVHATQNVHIIQMADIICPEDQSRRTVWDLRGTSLYNGGGHKITGLKAPLFYGVWGSVYNVHLVDSKVTNGSGLLAGANYGTITLCSATGELNITTGNYFGGLVGYNGGSITRSYTNCTITGNTDATSFVGGLAGYNYVTITACAALGTINVSGTTNPGTLVGYNSGTVIAYSYATANGEAIGGGNKTIQTDGDATTVTLVIDPTFATGISAGSRTFNGADPDWWWRGKPNYYIDYSYEGKP